MDVTGEGEFAAWAAAHAPGLHRFAFLLCADWHEAEDLAQEALARAALHWKRIRRVDHPDAYVRAIVVNQCRSMWRRPWRRATSSDAVDLVQADDADRVALHADLQVALQRLPVRQRATVVLRYFEDLTEADTAAVLGCSVGTVKSQHHKAMLALRMAMTKEGSQC